ncbi:MAG: hypothetical protein RL068_1124 [Actinomycetota bacterium]|jgi:hypothetical protein
MTREIIGFSLIALVLVVANLTWIVVTKRRTQQELFIAELVPTAAEGEFACLYVATVFASNPLERVWARGLGIRGRALVACGVDGISIHRQGEKSFLVPSRNLLGTSTGQAIIDKGVEKDGLLNIHWTHSDESFITALRFSNPVTRKQFESQLQTMIGANLG